MYKHKYEPIHWPTDCRRIFLCPAVLRVLNDSKRGGQTHTHTSERGYTFLQKTPRTFTQYWYPPSSRKGLHDIPRPEKLCQKRHSYTMADGQNPLTSANLGGNHHLTGPIPSNNSWNTSEHGMGRASKNSNHLSHDNIIPEFRHTFLWRRETGIFTQRGGHPLHLFRVCHGTLS